MMGGEIFINACNSLKVVNKMKYRPDETTRPKTLVERLRKAEGYVDGYLGLGYGLIHEARERFGWMPGFSLEEDKIMGAFPRDLGIVDIRNGLLLETAQENRIIGQAIDEDREYGGRVTDELNNAIKVVRESYQNPMGEVLNSDGTPWKDEISELVGKIPQPRSKPWYNPRTLDGEKSPIAQAREEVSQLSSRWRKRCAILYLEKVHQALIPGAKYIDHIAERYRSDQWMSKHTKK
jgi:hypothetical protein